MYDLSDLESEPIKEHYALDEEEILNFYDKLKCGSTSQEVQLNELENIFKEEFYYVGVDYFIVKGKSIIFKGKIVISTKENLIKYIFKVLQNNDFRSIFILPKERKNMLLLIDDEGSLILRQ